MLYSFLLSSSFADAEKVNFSPLPTEVCYISVSVKCTSGFYGRNRVTSFCAWWEHGELFLAFFSF